MPQKNNKKLLNLGCGQRCHSDWINLDLVSSSPQITICNLLKGIPYDKNYFDVVYHSHLLEHFSKTEATNFINECYRVLKPGGISRVAVPDLEEIINNYQKYFHSALKGDKQAIANYDWIMLELLDQCTRRSGGGEMGKYLLQDNIPNQDFVKQRIGYFYDLIRKSKSKKPLVSKSIISKISDKMISLSRKFFELLPGNQYDKISKFILSGENHLWMYDRFSLARLLKQSGFKQPKVVTAFNSQIPNWTKYYLDAEPDGTIYKPDSIFMEAIK